MNFSEPAEMYTGRGSVRNHAQPLAYRRFSNLALAVRYAVEQQPKSLHCTIIESGQERLQNKDIQTVYESDEFRAALGVAETG